MDKEKIVEKIAEKYEEIIKILELEKRGISKEHIKETPYRIAKMLVYELFDGVYSDPPKITTFPYEDDAIIPVTLSKIRIKSTCSHHFVPFSGYAAIQYLPDKEIIGISKLARIANYFSRRPQVQEELTSQIGNYIFEKIKPKYVAVVISAKHLCISHRGANEPDTTMTTTFFKSKNEIYLDKRHDIINQLINLIQ